jgi:hypothetical protein
MGIIFLSIAAVLAALRCIPDLIPAIAEAAGHPSPPDRFFAGVIFGAVIGGWMVLAFAWMKFRPRRPFLILYGPSPPRSRTDRARSVA